MADDSTVVGWQASPNRRGTLTIIENCLFTMFACTWSIQHLNVPGPKDTHFIRLMRKCKWAVFTIFFPEFLMAHAILEFVMAMDDMKYMKLVGKPIWRPWWLPKSCDDEEAGGRAEETKWTLTHCYFANMGGFYLREKTSPPLTAQDYLLTARHFADSWGRIEVPELSKDDLNDKGKTDYFAKAIAVIQIAQLLLSLIVRVVRRLAFTQLETLTLAFAICGVLTYICYWYKPQDVRRAIQVHLQPGKELPNLQSRTFDSLWEVVTNSKREDNKTLKRIPNDNIPKAGPQETHYALYVLTILTAGFGSIHAIAWNFEFPTVVERMLWRTATLVSMAGPPLALLAIPISQYSVSWGNSRDFMHTCLHVMREYSWHVADREQVQSAMQAIREVCDGAAGDRHYKDILGEDGGDGSSESLGREILGFINRDKNLRDRLPDDFREKFGQLVDLLGEVSGSKKLSDGARTDRYPRRPFFSTSVNLGIVYGMGIVYCLARLIIIGVAFSSLRRMPDSVYTTTWTREVPSLQ